MDRPESVLTLRWILRFVCHSSGVRRWLPQIQPSPLGSTPASGCTKCTNHHFTNQIIRKRMVSVCARQTFFSFFGDLFSYTTFTRTQRWHSASRTPHHGLPVTNNLPVWPRSMLSHRDRRHLSPYKPLAASVLSGTAWRDLTRIYICCPSIFEKT